MNQNDFDKVIDSKTTALVNELDEYLFFGAMEKLRVKEAISSAFAQLLKEQGLPNE